MLKQTFIFEADAFEFYDSLIKDGIKPRIERDYHCFIVKFRG